MIKKIIKKKRFWLVFKTFVIVLILSFCWYLFSFGQFSTSKNIPNEYIANYKINTDRQNLQWIFIEIESATKVGSEIPTSKFVDLNTSFKNIFEYFPQDYDFKLTYQACLTLSSELGSGYTYNRLTAFMDSCYKPLKQILDRINTRYTVKAEANVSPRSWPAPLTVTFDARASIDPSNETIPSKNYYRYYRDTNWVDKTMWIWPVLNYTFDNPGNYIVHLTVRSSNDLSKWIFDWYKTMSIDVSPKVASLVVYANWKKLDKFDKVKIWIQEAQKWVILDPSATVAMWWRVLQSYRRDITSADWFKYTKQWEWKPSIINLPLPWQWEFVISLTVSDNQNNNVNEKFFLLVSDPVAIIKHTPNEWNTSTIFSFDSSPSYSIVSNIRLITREIFDDNWDKMDIIQWKSIKKQFKKPGSYVVKLTVEDNLWQTNVDTLNLLVESTSPIPQFAMSPTLTWKNPSQFVLDASLSSDLDESNWYDELDFEWIFDKPWVVQILESKENNKIIKVNFNDVGKHKVKLLVKDKYAKISEIEKEIDIKSILRPEIFAKPKAIVWWNAIDFEVKTNKEIINYSRTFGDWETARVQTNKISHVYKKVWVYNVKLEVADANGMQNEVSEMVFIGDKDSPIAAYKVLDKQSTVMLQNDICEFTVWSNVVQYPAYKVDRYKDFRIDTSDSVNAKWEKTNLSFYFQPKNAEIYKQNQFTYKFDELGCSYVDLSVEDGSLNKTARDRVWFKVYNALPQINNIVLTYPQYGNEMWVWFQENNVKDIFNSNLDPLIVKVSVTNPLDPDGFISYYKWYYYYKDDPTRQIEMKITPSDIPYVFFSLPKMPGEFMFGVTMYDNDDGKQSSEDLIGNGPIVFFPPDIARPDVPMVTLKSNKTTVEIGDEVTFDVISKIVSDRPDFVRERTIQYDFDGDGIYDLTTKKDRVTYVYTKPNSTGYVPRASVLYRWYKWIGQWWNIVVKNALKPRLLTKLYDRLLLVRDISIWDISSHDLCLSLIDCRKWDDEFVFSGWQDMGFSFEYPEYKKYILNLDIEDKYANTANKKWTIDVISGVKKSDDIEILSLPEMFDSETGKEIFVWNSLKNSVLFYIYYGWENECYVDQDIILDSDGDANPANDKDFLCNELKMIEYTPLYQSTIGRVFYKAQDQKQLSRDFTVSFLDMSLNLDDETNLLYKDLMRLINWIDISKIENKWLKSLLVNLQQDLLYPANVKSNLVAVQSYVRDNKIILDTKQAELYDSIVDRLQNRASVAAMWGTEYDQYKAEILDIIPFSMRGQIDSMFAQFESVVSDFASWATQQDERKTILNQILSTIGSKVVVLEDWQELAPDQIDSIDMEMFVIPSMCNIMAYYSIPSEKCSTQDFKEIPSGVPIESQWMNKVVRILLWALGVLVGWFVVVIAIFAIKSKLTKSDESEEI